MFIWSLWLLYNIGMHRGVPQEAYYLGWLVGWLASNTPRTLLVPCWKRELYLIVLKQSGGIQGTCIESGTSNKLGQVENYLEAWTLVKANLIIQENITRSCLILAYLSKKKKKEKKMFDMSFTVCDLKKRITHYMFYPEIVVFWVISWWKNKREKRGVTIFPLWDYFGAVMMKFETF